MPLEIGVLDFHHRATRHGIDIAIEGERAGGFGRRQEIQNVPQQTCAVVADAAAEGDGVEGKREVNHPAGQIHSSARGPHADDGVVAQQDRAGIRCGHNPVRRIGDAEPGQQREQFIIRRVIERQDDAAADGFAGGAGNPVHRLIFGVGLDLENVRVEVGPSGFGQPRDAFHGRDEQRPAAGDVRGEFIHERDRRREEFIHPPDYTPVRLQLRGGWFIAVGGVKHIVSDAQGIKRVGVSIQRWWRDEAAVGIRIHQQHHGRRRIGHGEPGACVIVGGAIPGDVLGHDQEMNCRTGRDVQQPELVDLVEGQIREALVGRGRAVVNP
ncbi:MAG: hypothetical protein BWX84_02678 [Verrucomicrobia bacterium ADurb.Bin118]|nr:MAG: hypothetical protein BWX84_02678 [Verrucomicrobia bacterium ADurb.Bin118]